MKDTFKQAANVLLKRRLNNLLRIDNNLFIDKSYITCAEYQLFIDEKRELGESYQPEHWKGYRFPPGYAQKPITGIRASDAEKFCEWLTQKQSELGFRYRIPTLTEIEEHPAPEKQIGCWVKDGEKKRICGIEKVEWQQWKMNLFNLIVSTKNPLKKLDIISPKNLSLDLTVDLNSVLNNVLNPKFNSDLNPKLTSELNSAFNLRLNQVLKNNLGYILDCLIDNVNHRNLDSILEYLLTSDLNCNLYQTLYSVLNSNPNRIADRDLYSIVYNLLNPDLNIILEYELNHKGNCVVDLFRFYSLLVFLILYLLSNIYDAALKNNQALRDVKLTDTKCQKLSNLYAAKSYEAFNLYAFLRLITERQTGQMPAWEGIRIVRERVSL
ncbi:SUMF1/EgtB/PvdO family nonheme iron enzyme [Microcystis aeruginosa]|uniref:SUMF1/EgtB/PvdO family nonheme iron enzyme n=1 Tax=Microcystis aeruginosa TaxID=1126 RepID=UPI00232EDC8D|nr:SUMF1/EgtB/PvdO family nonheme iron enzyme [Microcystis aeruginosa]MDB9418314.1 SUMF1/EgtB/PvdO family nonheme iron enzyme [Microcystis aeruginosa CS-556/03]